MIPGHGVRVHLSRVGHRTDEKEVVAARVELGLKMRNKTGLNRFTIYKSVLSRNVFFAVKTLIFLEIKLATR